jgi:DNA transformation protein
MFGGAGIFRDERMFGLVVDGVIYLKTDADTVERFRGAGCRTFSYQRKGKPAQLNYWSAPDAALDDPDVMESWAALAWEAAARKAVTQKPRQRKKAAARGR